MDLFRTMNRNMAYGQLDFFMQDHKNRVDEFLNNIMIKIDLSKLYKIKDTCYYSQFMPFCPILLENTHIEGPKKYHLQVWDLKGNMIYEAQKIFEEPPVSWCITYEYFVYRPNEKDQEKGQDCYFIVNLNKKNETTIVNVAKHVLLGANKSSVIGFCNRCLFISNQQ